MFWRGHPLSTYANVSFSENFAYVLSGRPQSLTTMTQRILTHFMPLILFFLLFFTFFRHFLSLKVFLMNHSVQKVWIPPLPLLIFFPSPPPWQDFSDSIAPAKYRKNKNKLMWQSYFFIFWRLKNNVTCPFYKEHFCK